MEKDLEKKCFVMMPIRSSTERERWKRVLDMIIKPSIVSFNPEIEVVRVDELPGTGSWLKKIIEFTHEARLVVADLTTANPNVMWELGLRHATEKSGTIMITQDLNDAPLDLLSYNVLTYKEDGSDFDIFKDKMHSALAEIFSTNPKIDSPFFDHIDHNGGRVRDFKIHLFSEDSDLTEDRIILKMKEFNEIRPFKTEQDYFLEYQIIPRDAGYDQNQLNEYHEKLKDWASSMANKATESWNVNRIRAKAIQLDLNCENLSDVQADDVHIEITFDGDVEIFKDLPEVVGLPVRPKAPRHIHQHQMANLNSILGIAQNINDMFNTNNRITNMYPNVLRNPSTFDGCWVDDNVVTYHSNKIRQHFSRGDWEPFFIVPKENFKSASAIIEVRAKNVRGTFKREIAIMFE